MEVHEIWAALSVAVGLLALVFTTMLLVRQLRQMEHERNALAVLEATSRLTDPAIVHVFQQLPGIDSRYRTDRDIAERYQGSEDEEHLLIVAAYIETIAVLDRRGSLDPTILVDAVGLSLRQRWDTIRTFIERRRGWNIGNEFLRISNGSRCTVRAGKRTRAGRTARTMTCDNSKA